MTVPTPADSSDRHVADKPRLGDARHLLYVGLLTIVSGAVFDNRAAPFRRVVVLLVIAALLAGLGAWWMTGWSPRLR